MRSLDLVREYFEREAERFDAIYEREKPLHQRVVDRIFRSVVVERFKLICNLAPISGSWSVLDVGCGPGRYAIALAQRGATRVVGVDVATSMIDLACREAEAAGVRDRCAFQTSAFLDFQIEELFDAVVATGYFDYLEDPLPHARRMIEVCRGRVFASFPKRWEFRVPLRKVRFALEHGYVRFYSRREVVDLFAEAGLPDGCLSLVDLGRDFIAVARLTSR